MCVCVCVCVRACVCALVRARARVCVACVRACDVPACARVHGGAGNFESRRNVRGIEEI